MTDKNLELLLGTAQDPLLQHMRVPPQSMEAEASVLGGLLLDNGAWDVVGTFLNPSDFYRYEHRLIYAAISELLDATKPADVITVFERLKSQNREAEMGGLPYLGDLAQYVPSANNIRRYAEIVRERSVLRKLIEAGDQIVASGFNTNGRAVAEVLDEAERKVMGIGDANARAKTNTHDIADLVVQVLGSVEEHSKNPSDITGVATGFHEFDHMTSGLQAGDLIILAARPSMGKSSLALNIAENVADKLSLPVGIFSLEMSAPQLAFRFIGGMGRIDQSRLRTGKLQDEEWPRLVEAIERLRQLILVIDDTPSIKTSQIRSAARKILRQHGRLGLIVVDYLQLITGGGNEVGNRSDNRSTELGEITGSLKQLAREMGCPVIALSQLNRAVEQRTDKRPMMSDLRDSGALEQDADVVAFIYRDDYYNKDSKEPGVAEIIIAKQRNGPTGTFKLAFLKSITKFENLTAGAY
jgi:replicative DNA helicase